MDNGSSTPPAQPPRKRRLRTQIEQERRQQKVERKKRLKATRDGKIARRIASRTQLTEGRAKFWNDYFEKQPRGIQTTISEVIGVNRGNMSFWRNGSGWSAENVSMLLDHTPRLFDDAERADFIQLALRGHGYSDSSVHMVTSLSEWSSAAVLDLRRQEVEWFSTVVAPAASNIAYILTDLTPNGEPENNPESKTNWRQQRSDSFTKAIYAVLNRICGFYDKLYNVEKASVRACIFTPMASDPSFIELRWNKWVDGEAMQWNHWYIGEDPVPPGCKRGLAGRVWRAGVGKPCPRSVFDDPNFEDQHDPPRTRASMPYDSLVQVPILGKEQRKLGILSVDSLRHNFSSLDVQFMNHAALLLAPILERID